MSGKLNVSVLVAARDEYIEQLKCIISPLIIQGFNSIYQDAFKLSGGKRIIYKFQELLKEIPNWNQTILQEESKRIKKKCAYIMDIVTAIFVSNVKILASIRLKGNNDNIKVKIPTSDIFIHSIYIEAAQQFFHDPMLFYHHNQDIQKNKKYIKEIIYNSIDETIRQMLPFDDILQEYLVNALNDNIDADSDSESESETDENELQGNRIINDSEGSDSEPDETSNIVKNFNIGENGSTTFQEQPLSVPFQEPIAPFQQQPLPVSFQEPVMPEQPKQDDSGDESDSGSSSGSSSSGSSSSGSSSGSDSEPEHHSKHREKRKHHGKHRKKGYSFF
jgi:hypothetical protein